MAERKVNRVGKYKPVPISAAKKLAQDYAKDQVIILTWDAAHGMSHVTTYGRSVEDCAQAAEGGNRLKKALGWPDELCHAVPKRESHLRSDLAAALKRAEEAEAKLAAERQRADQFEARCVAETKAWNRREMDMMTLRDELAAERAANAALLHAAQAFVEGEGIAILSAVSQACAETDEDYPKDPSIPLPRSVADDGGWAVGRARQLAQAVSTSPSDALQAIRAAMSSFRGALDSYYSAAELRDAYATAEEALQGLEKIFGEVDRQP